MLERRRKTALIIDSVKKSGVFLKSTKKNHQNLIETGLISCECLIMFS